jgi:hypothetical protein
MAHELEGKLTPERAVRLLRAKGAQLEAQVKQHGLPGDRLDRFDMLAADIALIAQLLADHIERMEVEPIGDDELTRQFALADKEPVEEDEQELQRKFMEGFQEGRQDG